MNELYKAVKNNKDYNWHYLKDFEIPCNDVEVLIAIENGGYGVGFLDHNIWYMCDYSWEFTKVIAWKYIEKP